MVSASFYKTFQGYLLDEMDTQFDLHMVSFQGVLRHCHMDRALVKIFPQKVFGAFSLEVFLDLNTLFSVVGG